MKNTSSKEHNSKASSKKKSKSKKHSSRKKERGVVPYIVTPVIYVAISLIVILPAFGMFTNYSVSAVHEFQEKLPADYNDIKISTQRFDDNSLVYENELIGLCEKVGTIKCENAGIESEVYYGINRVSLRNGVGVSTESTFNDAASSFHMAGYATQAFKGLCNVREGDKIVFETNDKIYEYTVVSNTEGTQPESGYSSGMILSCEKNSKAFSAFSDEKRYVVASFSSIKDKKGA